MPGFTPTGMTQTDTEDARAGTAAHWLATEALRGAIVDVSEYADRRAPNGHYIDAEIIDNVNFYIEALAKRPPTREIEMPLSMVHGDVTVNCRPDFVAHDKWGFWIDDFKNGWEIVEAQENWQLLAYAFNFLPRASGPDTLYHMTIHQPRPFHPLGRSRTWTINALTLHGYYQQFIAQLARTDILQTGPSCYRCAAVTNCPAHRKATMRALDIAERAIPDQLTPDDMSYLKDNLATARKMLENYDSALGERIGEAIRNGQAVRNYWLEPVEGSLTWNDGITAEVLRLLAPGKVVEKAKPITPKQAMKFIPEVIINTLASRSSGGLKLIRKDANQMAQQLFNRNGE